MPRENLTNREVRDLISEIRSISGGKIGTLTRMRMNAILFSLREDPRFMDILRYARGFDPKIMTPLYNERATWWPVNAWPVPFGLVEGRKVSFPATSRVHICLGDRVYTTFTGGYDPSQEDLWNRMENAQAVLWDKDSDFDCKRSLLKAVLTLAERVTSRYECGERTSEIVAQMREYAWGDSELDEHKLRDDLQSVRGSFGPNRPQWWAVRTLTHCLGGERTIISDVINAYMKTFEIAGERVSLQEYLLDKEVMCSLYADLLEFNGIPQKI